MCDFSGARKKEMVSTSVITVRKILTEDLEVRNISAKILPKILTDE